MPVQFFSADRPVPVRDRTALKGFIQRLFRQEGRKLEQLNYIFCSDAHLLRINQAYLRHDDYTDIITFDLSEEPGRITGEIYISTDRVRENARQLRQSLRSEMHRVIFHGALHLCGYTDKKPADQQVMRLKEDHYLHQYFK